MALTAWADERETELAALITKLVQENWETRRKPLLLATLGLILRRDHRELIAPLTDTLQRFIERTRCAEIVRHPRQDQKVGALPIGTPVPLNVAELFEDGVHARRPKLIRSFWEAFHIPIEGRRFVLVDPVRVIEGGTLPPPRVTVYEILPNDIVNPIPQTRAEQVAATWDKVMAWLARNGLTMDKFVLSAVTDRQYASTHREVASQVERADLTGPLSRLSPQEQARIFIPLDIVLKLLGPR